MQGGYELTMGGEVVGGASSLKMAKALASDFLTVQYLHVHPDKWLPVKIVRQGETLVLCVMGGNHLVREGSTE